MPTMSDRKGYYLKPGVNVTAPGVLFSLVPQVQILNSGRDERDQFHVWDGAQVCVSHWRRNRWTRTRGAEVYEPEQLWEWMHTNGDKNRRNYVVCPNAAEALSICRFWEEAERGRVVWEPMGREGKRKAVAAHGGDATVIRRLCLSPTVTILDFARRGFRWIWLSGTQFFGAPETELAKTFDVGHATAPQPTTHDAVQPLVATERSRLWLSVFQRLADWWRCHSKAPFALTASGLSMGMLRTHIEPKAICTHGTASVHRLEREACHGGRASVWYYGDIGPRRGYSSLRSPAPARGPYEPMVGPLVHLDVRSMYPFLLREMRFPIKLIRSRPCRERAAPQEYAESFGVIADVTIETSVPEYPLRTKTGTIYPTGRFRTTLTGPELLMLKRDGRVRECHQLAVYQLGRPFRAVAGELVALREKARREQNPAWELFVKLVSNGLGGKLAQQKGRWVERRKKAPKQQWGEWMEGSGRGKSARKYRAVSGLVWEYERDPDGAGPYTFAFAYLTAYGRLHMRRLRDHCPELSVVSQDTDGLWVTPAARDTLDAAGLLGGDDAGCLRVVKEVPAARFFGPRHYWTPGEWVLAGFTAPSVFDKGRRLRYQYRASNHHGRDNRAPKGISVYDREADLKIEAPGVVIGADGWATAKHRS